MSEWDDDTAVPTPSGDGGPMPPHPGDRDRAYLIMLTGSNVGEMIRLELGAVTIVGRGREADVHIFDDSASRRHARIRTLDGDAVIEDLGSRNGTFVNGVRVERHKLDDGDKIQIGATTILKFTYHDHFDETFQRRMFESALRDGLTLAYNKRYLIDRLGTELRFARRHGAPLTLILLDVDHFKQVNDVHGHMVGDQVLASLARRIRDIIRNEDVLARYGGEEFAILCRAIAPEQAAALAERLRRTVEGMAHAVGGTTVRVTVSLGVASLPAVPAREPLELLAAADDALYAAKRAGRNRVCTADGAR